MEETVGFNCPENKKKSCGSDLVWSRDLELKAGAATTRSLIMVMASLWSYFRNAVCRRLVVTVPGFCVAFGRSSHTRDVNRAVRRPCGNYLDSFLRQAHRSLWREQGCRICVPHNSSLTIYLECEFVVHLVTTSGAHVAFVSTIAAHILRNLVYFHRGVMFVFYRTTAT